MMRQRVVIVVIVAFTAGSYVRAQAPVDLNDQLEKAMKDAVAKAAPSVVQIITQGGADLVVTGPKGPAFRKALGPTTGVIVDAGGYVISSAFNFINNPTTISVSVPGHAEAYVAQRVATDKARMLTLLKIEAKGLQAPQYVPRKEIHEGQWAIALGRTLDVKKSVSPSVSVGIISAVGRIWGRAIQTDAKISPLNYGGPIVDLRGRVQGILVPASPRGDDETAGFEWYDSGIGFAVPMEDVRDALPRLKLGKDLNKGLLGIRLKSADIYGAVPEIGEVTPGSAAARAGLKPGDIIVDIDGQPVVRMAQIMHLLGPKYEGDKISLKYKRDKDTHTVANLELVGVLQIYAHPYLGILPMRDDPKLGVEIRFVFPKSPAEKVGLKTGDRILKVGVGKTPPQSFTGAKRSRDQLLDFLNTRSPGGEVLFEVKRKDGKTDTVKVTLETMPGSIPGLEMAIPEKLPEEASVKKALEPLETSDPKVKPPKIDPVDKKAETGLVKKANATGEHKYWIFVPETYDPNVAHALLVWLHPPGKNQEEDMEAIKDLWIDYCEENNMMLLCPLSENDSGWVPSEADAVLGAVGEVLTRYSIDRQRIVAHGMGVGGQMAIYLGFTARDVIRGVATVGAVPTHIKDNMANQRLSFYLAGGSQDPLVKAIAEGKVKLTERRFPVFFREIAERGREYLESAQRAELARWIDALDRQ